MKIVYNASPISFYAKLKPCFVIGIVRMRSPVAVKIALQTAGKIGNTSSANQGLRFSHIRLRRLECGSGRKLGRYSAYPPRFSYRISLRETEALLRHRHGANAFARCGENCIANGGQNRRQRGFAQTGWRIIGFQEMNFDGRRLRHFQPRANASPARRSAPTAPTRVVRSSTPCISGTSGRWRPTPPGGRPPAAPAS